MSNPLQLDNEKESRGNKLLPLMFQKLNEFAQNMESPVQVIIDGQLKKVGQVEIDYFHFGDSMMMEDLVSADRFAGWLWHEVDDYNWSFSVDALHSVNWGHETEKGLQGNIGILHKMLIEQPYRNMGLGREVLIKALEFFRSKDLDYVILQPYPFEQKDTDKFDRDKKRLLSFYGSAGFEEFLPSDRLLKNPYMFLSLRC